MVIIGFANQTAHSAVFMTAASETLHLTPIRRLREITIIV